MHVRLIAVGDNQPSWVDAAFSDYTARLPRHWKFRLDTIATANRKKSGSEVAAMKAEGRKILANLKFSEYMVLLDERGQLIGSRALGSKVDDWQSSGRDLCFVIGGPDGVSAECEQRADFRWSLSTLTLPHGLARVLFAEQLYRAWTLTQGHPYHRD